MKKKYCIWCGKEYDEELKECPDCHKNPDPKENMFLNYLKEKTKDKLKDDTEENIYEIIKNFLLSHIYGFVVTLSLVVAGVVTVANDNNYIHHVYEMPAALQESFGNNQTTEPNETNPENNDNGSDMDPKSSNYNEELVKNRLDMIIVHYFSEGLSDDTFVEIPKEDFWSDKFSAKHELADGMADTTIYGQEPIGYTRRIENYYGRYEPFSAESQIAKEAVKQGYSIYHVEVGDRIYKHPYYEPSITAKYSVYFIYVEEIDDWKILEEIRTELEVKE